ncbi:MAG: indolepyruvate oxidoreductase subunit beta [Candidatus Wallbacteria bacterium]|nr:indolepyruvate oxidoreductase subunit beta [Candidatus Wallbacteria bacterium]
MNELKAYQIIMAGVGGQGLMKASDLLARAAFHAGFDVKKSEVHGLAQRGGSLLTQIKIGPVVHSPLIDPGYADFLLGFEKLEAYRYCGYLKPGGLLIYDDLEIVPIGYRRDEYPAQLKKFFEVQNFRSQEVQALLEAQKLGDTRIQNVLLLKALNSEIAIPREAWEKSFRESFKPGVCEKNWQIFQK